MASPTDFEADRLLAVFLPNGADSLDGDLRSELEGFCKRQNWDFHENRAVSFNVRKRTVELQEKDTGSIRKQVAFTQGHCFDVGFLPFLFESLGKNENTVAAAIESAIARVDSTSPSDKRHNKWNTFRNAKDCALKEMEEESNTEQLQQVLDGISLQAEEKVFALHKLFGLELRKRESWQRLSSDPLRFRDLIHRGNTLQVDPLEPADVRASLLRLRTPAAIDAGGSTELVGILIVCHRDEDKQRFLQDKAEAERQLAEEEEPTRPIMLELRATEDREGFSATAEIRQEEVLAQADDHGGMDVAELTWHKFTERVKAGFCSPSASPYALHVKDVTSVSRVSINRKRFEGEVFAEETWELFLAYLADATKQSKPKEMESLQIDVVLYVDGIFQPDKGVAAECSPELGLPDQGSIIHPEQKEVALRLYHRLCKALEMKGKKLSDFQALDFVILVPDMTTLKIQTELRVFAVLFGLDCTAVDAAKNTVVKHHTSNTPEREAFHKRVREHPERLSVLISDECHWGINKGSPHDLWINNRDLLPLPNFVVVQVSATPYTNLLKESRLPANKITEFEDGNPCGRVKGYTAGPVGGEEEELNVVHWYRPGQKKTSTYFGLEDFLRTIPSFVRHEVAGKYHRQDESGIRRPRHLQLVRSDPGLEMPPKRTQRRTENDPIQEDVWVADFIFSMTYFALCRWDKEQQQLKALPALNNEHETEWEQNQQFWETLGGEFVETFSDLASPVKGKAGQKTLELALEEARRHHGVKWDADDLTTSHSKLAGWVLMTKMIDESEICHADTWTDPETGSMRFSTFTETDRIVKNLLPVGPVNEQKKQGRAGKMTVVRVFRENYADMVNDHLKRCRNLLFGQQDEAGENGSDACSPFAIIKDCGSGTISQSFGNSAFWDMPLLVQQKKGPNIQRTLREVKDQKTIRAKEAHRAIQERLRGFSRKEKASEKGKRLSQELAEASEALRKVDLQYTDLEGLPCLLLLVEKGRMGDTFPHSFNCLDMRCRASDNTTTLVQELGRLSRYSRCNLEPSKSTEFTEFDKEDAKQKCKSLFAEAPGNTLAVFKTSGPVEELVGYAFDVKPWAATASPEIVFNGPVSDLRYSQRNRKSGKHLILEPACVVPETGLEGCRIVRFPLQIPSKQWKTLPKDLNLASFVYRTITKHEGKEIELDEKFPGEVDISAEVYTKYLKDMNLINGGYAILRDVGCLDWLCDQCPGGGVIRVLQHELPYAVVPQSLMDKLREGVYKADVTAREVRFCVQVGSQIHDHVIRKASGAQMKLTAAWQSGAVNEFHDYKSCWKPLVQQPLGSDSKGQKAKIHHFDAGNDEKHDLRFLLFAECQIGKTGTYLHFLRLLRDDIEGEDLLDHLAKFPPLPSDEDIKLSLTVPWQWQLPYWLDLSQERCPWSLENGIHEGKYHEAVKAQRLVLLLGQLDKQNGGGGGGEERGWAEKFARELAAIPYARGDGGECVQSAYHQSCIETLKHTFRDKPCPLLLCDQLPEHNDAGDVTTFKVLDAPSLKRIIDWDCPGAPWPRSVYLAFRKPTGKRQTEEQPVTETDPLCITSKDGSKLVDKRGDTYVVTVPRKKLSVQIMAWESPAKEKEGSHLKRTGQKVERHPYIATAFKQPKPATERGRVLSLCPTLRGIDLRCLFGNKEDWPKIWVPNSEQLGWFELEGQHVVGAKSPPDLPKHLKNWVFTPSYRRDLESARATRKPALLDRGQAFTSGGEQVHARQVLLVRQDDNQSERGQFTAYTQDYGSDYVIVSLPSCMVMSEKLKEIGFRAEQFKHQLDRNDQARITPEQGGIGYCRLFAQIFAHLLSLEQVWMLDDNVLDCYELDLSTSLGMSPPTHVPPIPCSFSDIMLAVENLLKDGSDCVPADLLDGQEKRLSEVANSDNDKFKRWPESDLRNGHTATVRTAPKDKDAIASGSIQTRKDFCGPSNAYAVLGISRRFDDYWTIQKPFVATHSVYSFYLLNVKATIENGVLYPPKMMWEDIEFNQLCEEKGLAIARYDRFFHNKLWEKVIGSGARKREAALTARVAIEVVGLGEDLWIEVPQSNTRCGEVWPQVLDKLRPSCFCNESIIVHAEGCNPQRGTAWTWLKISDSHELEEGHDACFLSFRLRVLYHADFKLAPFMARELPVESGTTHSDIFTKWKADTAVFYFPAKDHVASMIARDEDTDTEAEWYQLCEKEAANTTQFLLAETKKFQGDTMTIVVTRPFRWKEGTLEALLTTVKNHVKNQDHRTNAFNIVFPSFLIADSSFFDVTLASIFLKGWMKMIPGEGEWRAWTSSRPDARGVVLFPTIANGKNDTSFVLLELKFPEKQSNAAAAKPQTSSHEARGQGHAQEVVGQDVCVDEQAAEPEDDRVWRTEGSELIGEKVRTFFPDTTDIAGEGVVAKWLPKEESDFVNQKGRPAALFKILFDDGWEYIDMELEEHEVREAMESMKEDRPGKKKRGKKLEKLQKEKETNVKSKELGKTNAKSKELPQNAQDIRDFLSPKPKRQREEPDSASEAREDKSQRAEAEGGGSATKKRRRQQAQPPSEQDVEKAREEAPNVLKRLEAEHRNECNARNVRDLYFGELEATIPSLTESEQYVKFRKWHTNEEMTDTWSIIHDKFMEVLAGDEAPSPKKKKKGPDSTAFIDLSAGDEVMSET